MALTKGGTTILFQYDNAGNLLVDDKAWYCYDAFNRTTKVETFDGNVQINRYDAEGLRYEMEENGNLVRFIFNQNKEAVTEQDANGITRLIRSTELIARNTDTVRTYYHYASDEMGSTTHIVDETGEVQNRYAYDAWGNLTLCEEKIPNRFKFTGQQLDPITQQYYLRARFYNPVIARFTQEDIYRGDGLNLYAYCSNNPVYYVDPSGYVQQVPNTPQGYAQWFSLDFGQSLSKSDAEDIALMLGDDLRSGRLLQLNGTKENQSTHIGRKHKNDTLDIAYNPDTGKVYFGISGSKNNPTRHPDGLPQLLKDIADVNQNPALAPFVQVDLETGEIKYSKKWHPGDCGEYSSAAHILAAGDNLNDYNHIAVAWNKEEGAMKVKSGCVYCNHSILSKEIVSQFVARESNLTETRKTQLETPRSEYNPRKNCS